MSKPRLYMLVGVPGSGKSTWIERGLPDEGRGRDTTVLSTDYFIECAAKRRGMSYNEVFQDTIKHANRMMYAHLDWAIERNHNIIWDQTNTSRKSRKEKLAKIPDNYKKIAVFFPVPDADELERRLASRPGKIIPKGVMQNMIDCLNKPTVDEGFDEVRVGN